MNDLLVLGGNDVRRVLDGRERDVLNIVRQAYEAHAEGNSVLPHSTFVGIPGRRTSRVIALPGYVGGAFDALGIKWISSFPENVARGQERASAAIILNCTDTGRPRVLLEGSDISAARTAAGAVLALSTLAERYGALGVAGAGRIAFETVRFLCACGLRPQRLIVHDVDAARAAAFVRRCSDAWRLDGEVATVGGMLEAAHVNLLTTSATAPHIHALPAVSAPRTILHLSLRDLSPGLILGARNVVDDVDHVCRAQTSVHLAQQQVGHTGFIAGTLVDVLQGRVAPRANESDTVVFSPFGLGVLDLAVATFVHREASSGNLGRLVEDFFPEAALQGVPADVSVH